MQVPQLPIRRFPEPLMAASRKYTRWGEGGSGTATARRSRSGGLTSQTGRETDTTIKSAVAASRQRSPKR